MNDDSAVLEDVLAELDHHLKARGLKDAHPYFSLVQKQLLRLFARRPAGSGLPDPPSLSL